MNSSIAYTMSTLMTLYSSATEIKSMPIELFDWIANNKNIRGSKPNDIGVWIHNSAKPLSFCPLTRVVVLEDGTRYLLKKKTVCKALGLDKASEQALSELVIT
jgi:hypothetical protein